MREKRPGSTKAQEDSLERAAKCFSFSVFVGSVFHFLLTARGFYTVSVAGGPDRDGDARGHEQVSEA